MDQKGDAQTWRVQGQGLMWESWASRGYRCKHKYAVIFLLIDGPGQMMVVRGEC